MWGRTCTCSRTVQRGPVHPEESGRLPTCQASVATASLPPHGAEACRPLPASIAQVRAAEALRDEIEATTNCSFALQNEHTARTEPHNIYVGATLRLRGTGRLHWLGEEEAVYLVDGPDLFVIGDDTGTPLHGNSTAAWCGNAVVAVCVLG